MRILLIGGTNFIGPPVVRHLCAMGHEVTVFHRGKTSAELPLEVNQIIGDRANLPNFKREFERVSPQVVLDMIPYTEQDALTLMSTFKGITQRIVAISSMDVYRAYSVLLGKEAEVVPIPLKEDSPLRQQLYPYRDRFDSNSEFDYENYEKILVEKVVMSEPDLPGTILRLPMVYGSGDFQHRLYSYLKRMDDNRPAIVLEESIARWCGCYGYVENVAYGIALAVIDERASDRIYNIADSLSLTEAERIRNIGRIAGWNGEVVVVPKSQMPAEWKPIGNTEQHWIADTTRIRQELGYSEIVPLQEALLRSIEWQRAHPPEKPEESGGGWLLLDYATEDAILTKLV
ncbi:MAG TPA: NAD-dependent dehydratase [Cyanobacteria bacterium UBA11049]|nr:NAD-dependent dehydratase [Cyanobacteria bacterium UBA11049]